MSHPLAELTGTIDWGFLEKSFGRYMPRSGTSALTDAGLAILKHKHDLSDEALCDRWLENRYFKLFCGEESFSTSCSSTARR